MLGRLKAWRRRRAQERFDRGQYEPLPAKEIEWTPAEIDGAFLSSFREHEPALGLDQLASGWDLDETREWAASAEERGLLARSGDGRWQITDEGREHLARIEACLNSVTVGIPERGAPDMRSDPI